MVRSRMGQPLVSDTIRQCFFFLTRLTNTYVTSENFLWLSIAVVMNLLYGWGVCYSGAAITLAYNRRLIDN